MVQKLSQFGIRTGTFNCSNDNRSQTVQGQSQILMWLRHEAELKRERRVVFVSSSIVSVSQERSRRVEK
ncbi:hypothetical protein AMECASPLE_037306 [Ameca splendens]|uniref:Uncharacterized protein n=1 Tax=Ameca splendens TaxID=208324 RepID=A0ABV0YJM3_9TELE